ncbi:disulfide bond formation protein B [Alkalilacustris brevis]|uniref:disulfide bond formation protein B n=1 Tax=Alkalilacustris brevis TaxID=2026338 RepID=UPI000E0DDA78|nr:disulfide bond formation protein B [Alkalilacustris brevis]
MTRSTGILLAAAGSLGLLLAALVFQYGFGMAPCALCIWQRWPHLVAVALAGPAVALAGPLWPLLGGAAAATSGGIGVYHTGVERGWWQGPQACSAGPDIGALSPEELFAQIMAAPVVRCDEVPWEMLGLSMASWNALASFGLAALWVAVLWLPRGQGRGRV